MKTATDAKEVAMEKILGDITEKGFFCFAPRHWTYSYDAAVKELLRLGLIETKATKTGNLSDNNCYIYIIKE